MEDISFQIVTLYNPSQEPFDIVYNNRIFRTIPPGKAMRLPKRPFGMLAEKHLIDRMLNQEGKPTNEATLRAKWREKIVLEEDVDNAEKVLDRNEVLSRKLDRLNTTNESGAILTCDQCGTKTFNLVEHSQLNHPAGQSAPVAPTVPVQPTTEAVPAQPAAARTLPIITADQVQTDNVPVVSATDPTTIPTVAEKPAPTTDAQKDVANIVGGIASRGEGYKLPEQTIQEAEPSNSYAPPYGDNPTREQLIQFAQTQNFRLDIPANRRFLEEADLEIIKKELSYGI